MATKSELKIAEQILDRFYRDAEGKTNRQVDVYYALEDMGIARDKADPAITYLVSRGLVNTFGPDIAFLTDRGVQVMIEEIDISTLDKVLKDFIQKPVEEAPAPPPPAAEGKPAKAATARPKVASLTHIDLEGQEYTLALGWVCTIGRADANHVRVNDQRASKKHAEIRYEDGGFVLHDLESANGTLLNGQYVVEPEPLKHDDEVVIGRTMLLFTAPHEVAAPAGPPPGADEPAEEPATIVPMAPTERPAEVDPPSIRVVKGTPAPAPVAPSVKSDLFAEPAREASGADLFGGTEPAPSAAAEPFAGKSRPAPRPPSDDLFGGDAPAPRADGDLFGEASKPAASSDDLFGEPSQPGASSEDLFGEASRPGASGDDLFADASRSSGDDLFEDKSRPGATTPPPKTDLFGDEPPTEAGSGSDLFDRNPTQTGRLEPPTVTPEVQSVPVVPLADMADIPSAPPGALEEIEAIEDDIPVAPESTADWDEDTPPSAGPTPQQLLENQPVRSARKDDAAATVMMTREAIFGEGEGAEEEPPHWGDDRPPMGSHPAFGDAAEALPVATASLANLGAPDPTDDVADDGAGDTMDSELSAEHTFHETLKVLRAQTERADLPDRDAVLQAIDLLFGHPYVRVVLQKISD
ncbi:MAG: FHA domain-containing protein [Deltaproteobacteria bacterium]